MKAIADFMDTWIGRLIRAGVSTGLSLAVAKYQHNSWYVSLTPVFQATSKFLRDKFPNTLWEVLPF